MLTVWLPMCSTVAPLARGAGGDIPSKGLGQGFTRSSTFTHLLGAAGAPTGVPSGAADGCPSMPKVVLRPSVSVFHAVFCGGGTHHTPLSAAIAKNRVSNASGGPENVQRMFFNHMHCICPNDSCNTPFTVRTTQSQGWKWSPFAASQNTPSQRHRTPSQRHGLRSPMFFPLRSDQAFSQWNSR